METLKQTILVVEDDELISRLVEIYLTQAGYEVFIAKNGMDARDQFLKHDPCLVILDLMLPGISGEELCRVIREEWQSKVPIIMVTAKIQEKDRIAGLKMGADDYVTKPFSPEELTARVEAVLRRTGEHCNKITYHGISLKPKKQEVWLEGRLLDLTLTEFTLIHQLMKHPNQVMSREQLLIHLYPLAEKDVNERTIDVHVKNLRDKLEKEPSNPKRILTVRGVGYKFVV